MTLYEYGVHYGGYPSELQQVETQLVQHFAKNCDREWTLNLEDISILGDSIVCNINMGLKEKEIAAYMAVYEKSLLEFVNINAIPVNLHITLARFVTYTEQYKLDRLNLFLKNLPLPTQEERIIKAKSQLVHIGMTPYNNVKILAGLN